MQGISYLIKAFTVPVKIDVALSTKRSVQLKSMTSPQFTMCLAKVIEFGNYMCMVPKLKILLLEYTFNDTAQRIKKGCEVVHVQGVNVIL